MNRGGRIALLTDQAVGEYQTELRRAVVRACRERELDVLMYVGARFEATARAQRARNVVYDSISRAGVSGVLVTGGVAIDCGELRFAEFCRSFLPLPVCVIGTTAPGLHSVGVDDAQGMCDLVEHLIAVHARTRIGLVTGPRGLSESESRIAGYIAAHERHGLTVDRRRLVEGNFSVESGYAAGRALLAGRACELDAIVAANDNMAFGVTAVARELGLRIPEQIAVGGFDDSPASRTARPSLSTSRQPLLEQARLALDLLDGARPPGHYVTTPTLICRDSCGCGYRSRPIELRASIPPGLPAVEVVASRRERMVTSVAAALASGLPAAAVWAERMTDALLAELRGADGAFLIALELILDELHRDGGVVEDLYAVVAQLADSLQRDAHDREQLRIETVWQQALLLIGDFSTQLLGRERMQLELTAARLQHIGERLATSLNAESLKRVLASELPSLGISDALISLQRSDRQLVPWFALRESEQLTLEPEPYARELLCPHYYSIPSGIPSVVTPLTTGTEVLGLAVFALGDDGDMVYDQLRDHLSAALQLATLHRAVVEETVRQHQAEQQRLQRELDIARRIQAQVLPRELRVHGLELTATMISATEVGGDYYDVHPVEGGAWIGIGDVAGHGLPAGLVMLVIQSAVASLVESAAPDAAPRTLVSLLNRAVVEGVRGRLGRDEHATLMLARYESSGRFTFAGAHEDLIVYRAQHGRCELVPTVGTWIGVMPDIAAVTPDSSLQLSPGDILILYSDGVTEAFDTRRQQFGPERVCEIVERLHERTVEQIRDAIIEAVQSWMDRQRDDITLLVARFVGDPDR